jgi:hypothetical protein
MPKQSHRLQEKQEQHTAEAGALHKPVNNPQVADSQDDAPPPIGEELLDSIRAVYVSDNKLGHIMANFGQHPDFAQSEGLLYFSHRHLLCIPEVCLKNRRVAEMVIDMAHITLSHLGCRRTLAYLRQWYWWLTMAKDMDEFCKSCGACQMTKPLT